MTPTWRPRSMITSTTSLSMRSTNAGHLGGSGPAHDGEKTGAPRGFLRAGRCYAVDVPRSYSHARSAIHETLLCYAISQSRRPCVVLRGRPIKRPLLSKNTRRQIPGAPLRCIRLHIRSAGGLVLSRAAPLRRNDSQAIARSTRRLLRLVTQAKWPCTRHVTLQITVNPSLHRFRHLSVTAESSNSERVDLRRTQMQRAGRT